MTKRVVTALVAAAVLLVVLYFRNVAYGAPLYGTILALYAIALFEVFGALRTKGYRPARWACVLTAALLLPAYLWRGPELLWTVFAVGVVLALASAVFEREHKEGDILVAAFPLLYPTVPFIALLLIASFPEPYKLSILLAVLISSIASDVFALVAGSLFGKHKLIPAVSPHKTWEGAIGGLVMSIVCTMAYGLVLGMLSKRDFSMLHFALLGAVGSVATQVGDLIASAIKRHCGVKDFGNFFPGHGGVLDRMDGMLLNAVLLWLYATLAFPGVLP